MIKLELDKQIGLDVIIGVIGGLIVVFSQIILEVMGRKYDDIALYIILLVAVTIIITTLVILGMSIRRIPTPEIIKQRKELEKELHRNAREPLNKNRF